VKGTTCILLAAVFGGMVICIPASRAQAADKPVAAKPDKAPRGDKAPKDAAARVAAIKGELVSVNVETGELKVRVGKKDQPAEEKTIQTDKNNVQVKIGDAAATLADLKPGMRVKISPATGLATQIDAVAAPVKKEARDGAKKADKPAANH